MFFFRVSKLRRNCEFKVLYLVPNVNILVTKQELEKVPFQVFVLYYIFLYIHMIIHKHKQIVLGSASEPQHFHRHYHHSLTKLCVIRTFT